MTKPLVVVLEGVSTSAVDDVANRLSSLGKVVMFEYWLEIDPTLSALSAEQEHSLRMQWVHEWKSRLSTIMADHPNQDVYIVRGVLSMAFHCPIAEKQALLLKAYQAIRKQYDPTRMWVDVNVKSLWPNQPQSCVQMVHTPTDLEQERVTQTFQAYGKWDIQLDAGVHAPGKLSKELGRVSRARAVYTAPSSSSVTRPYKSSSSSRLIVA
jgi:hypothetical protein